MKREGRSTKCQAGGVLVCFALKEEAAPFHKISATQANITILLTGIGRRNASKAVHDFLAAQSPQLVFTCGFAGGLNPALDTGAVVFDTSQPELRETLLAAGARPVKFHCASRIAITTREKHALRSTTGADAVEMESEAIHAVCRERGIPCATVRVISDSANEDLPLDFNQLARHDLTMDYCKLALALAKSPGRIPALLRLQQNCRRAAGRLAEVLPKVIESCWLPAARTPAR